MLSVLICVVVASCATPVVRAPGAPAPAPVPGVARDFARIEAEVLAALNRARTDPVGTSASLQDLTRYFDGNRFHRPSWPNAIMTVEGVSAVQEAVRVVRAQRPVAALTLNAALTRAARDHATDQGKSGRTGHTGSDGSTVATRVARYGTWLISLSENIDYAPMMHGRDVIESLLIDDGVRDRAHRRNIFEPTARMVGIACGPHPRFTATCVIVQAGGVAPK